MLTDHLLLALWQRKSRYLWICRNHYTRISWGLDVSSHVGPSLWDISYDGHICLMDCVFRHLGWITNPLGRHPRPKRPPHQLHPSQSLLPFHRPSSPSLLLLHSTHHLPCVCSLFNPPPHPQCGPSLFSLFLNNIRSRIFSSAHLLFPRGNPLFLFRYLSCLHACH